MDAVDFISQQLTAKQHFFEEVIGDVKRLSKLAGHKEAANDVAKLSRNWDSFISDRKQRDALTGIMKSLTNHTAMAGKFTSRTEAPADGFSFVDLFSGCGGLSYGLSTAGFTPHLVNEIDEAAAFTHFLNADIFPDKYFVGDVKDLHPQLHDVERLKGVDLVCGGPPCQGFSTANRQRLIDDPRNRLYTHFIRIVGMIRPKVILIENVRGMAARAAEIIEDIRLSAGGEYKADYAYLDAHEHGAPQRRVRFFLVATRLPTSVADIFSGVLKDPHRFVLRDALYGLPRVTPKTEPRRSSLENEKHGYRIARGGKPAKNAFLERLNGGRPPSWILNHVSRYNNPRDVEIFERLPQGADSLHPSISDIMPYKRRNHIFKDKYYKLKEDAPCKTITSHMRFDCNMYIHPEQARGLTAREAARIQTFPDDYFFMGRPNAWYTQVGNAVPVSMAAAIGRSIAKCLKEHSA
jgi:DNA (cytosine-5)-methyltransferase 1